MAYSPNTIITDPTTSANQANVKGATTAATTSDKALVVALSPNTTGNVNVTQIGGSSLSLGQEPAASSIPVVTQSDATPATQNITAQDTVSISTPGANAQGFITGSPTAGSTASFALSSFESVEVQVLGTWTGTLQTEISMDGGTTWFTRGVKQAGSAYIGSSYTANFEGGCNFGGMTNFRVRATAAWTGTATVRVVASINPASITVSNPLTLRDSTTQSIANTIKAASTPAASTDTSIVVALNPNTPLPTGTNPLGSVAVTGVTEVSPTGSANTAANPFFNEITDGTNPMGAMANVGSSPGAVKALNANASLLVGTTPVSGSSPVPVSATTAANTATNPIFNEITDGTNPIGAMANFATTPGAVKSIGVNASVFVGLTGVSTTNPMPVSATTAANTATNPIFNEITDGTNPMGAMANFGTSPGAVKSLDVNASIFVGITGISTTNPMPVSATTAANTVTNPIFVEPSDGTNAMGAMANFGTSPGTVKSLDVNASVFFGLTGVSTANPMPMNLGQVGGNTVVTGGTSGSQGVGGLAASGSAVAGNPVLSGGSDGTNARSLLTDTSGRQMAVGAAASASAVAGNPVLSGGSDGTNARSLLTDTSGRQVVVGAAADGATAVGNPVLVGGSDGTNAQAILTDTSGNQQIVGSVASLAADSGKPVKVGTVFNTTLPGPTNGQRVDVQSNRFGELTIQYRNKSTVVTASGSTTVKTGAGRLHGIITADNSGTTVIVYDNTASSGTQIAYAIAQATAFLGPLGIEFATGLTVNLSAGDHVTIIYQ